MELVMQEFLSITLLIILAAISPGPDFAMVTKNSLMYTRRHGIATALGVSISLLIHASYCILGLALVVSQSLLAFNLIKTIGAIYLIYIGTKSLLAKRTHLPMTYQHSFHMITVKQAFYQGFWGNLLNPKAIMFLLAFFTLIVKPDASTWLAASFAIEISIIHMIWFSLLSYILTHRHVKKHLARMQYYIVKVMGVLLVAFGVRIATLNPH